MSRSCNAVVTDIQRFSLHDGPGIRTTFFFKGCGLRCLWCANPEALEIEPTLYFSKSKCIACGSCAKVCPEQCIEIKDVANVDRTRCNDHFKCIEVCPTGALSIKGTSYSINELFEIAKKDIEFYRKSNGGITVSGGDPMLQYEAVSELFKKCRNVNIHTAVETAANVPWQNFERVLPYCDLVILDLKHAVDEQHRKLTGFGNKQIIQNFPKLYNLTNNLLIRLTMIPGLNNNPEDIEAMINLLKPYDVSVEVLKFHQLGQNKYEAINKDYKLKGVKPMTNDDIVPVINKLLKAGIRVINK